VRYTIRHWCDHVDGVCSGLGVGIAAQAFIAHGINTTIVEIDPAVYTYAREYFGLPEPNDVYLEDAREWLQRHTPSPAGDKFDFVVHDCFSGGGVPAHIFTVEFWEELKGVVKSDGVVAVVCIPFLSQTF
jgi:spermidine synthase